MSKTLLIIIGLLAALLIAAGMMWYHTDAYYINNAPMEQLDVLTSLQPIDEKTNAALLSTPNDFDQKLCLPDNNTPITPYIISYKIDTGIYIHTIDKHEVEAIEKKALDYINKIITPEDRLISIMAQADISFTVNHERAVYNLDLSQDNTNKGKHFGGKSYNIIFKKSGSDWIIIHVSEPREFWESKFIDALPR